MDTSRSFEYRIGRWSKVGPPLRVNKSSTESVMVPPVIAAHTAPIRESFIVVVRFRDQLQIYNAVNTRGFHNFIMPSSRFLKERLRRPLSPSPFCFRHDHFV